MMRLYLCLFFIGLALLIVGLMPVVGHDTGWLAIVGGISCIIGAVGANHRYFLERGPNSANER